LPDTFNFELQRGDDVTLTIYVYQADKRTPQNLTGCSLWFTAKKNLADVDADAAIRKSTVTPPGGITITDIPGGVAAAPIAPSDTSGLPAEDTRLNYDIQLKGSDGKVKTILRGTIVVVPDTTISTS